MVNRRKNHRSKRNHRSNFDAYVDRLVRKNTQNLKRINKWPPKATDGEDAVRSALRKLDIRYVREYYVDTLKGDTKKFRIVDFYLPKEEIFIEFLGNWNTGEEHKRRYKHKMLAFHLLELLQLHRVIFLAIH